MWSWTRREVSTVIESRWKCGGYHNVRSHQQTHRDRTVGTGSILGTGIPNEHPITQRRGPSEWSSCGIAIVGTAECLPGLNSARAAAACRSVRDALLQVSMRLQDCQERCRIINQHRACKCKFVSTPAAPCSLSSGTPRPWLCRRRGPPAAFHVQKAAKSLVVFLFVPCCGD